MSGTHSTWCMATPSVGVPIGPCDCGAEVTPYLRDADCTLWHGDAIAVLCTLGDDSVDCVVTSPPYWGLRDYGTGTWDGGDDGCDHVNAPGAATGNKGAVTTVPYRDICRCGARRVDQQLGLEETPEDFILRLVEVFRQVRRVLAPHGTCWVNLGDSYAAARSYQVRDSKHTDVGNAMAAAVPEGLKPKDLVGIPWRVAFALQADGWWLRSAITWCKPNAMPESVTDRPTKSTEMVFLLTKAPRYYYDAVAIRRPHQHDGRALTTVTGRDGSLQHRDGERWPGTGANERDWWLIPTQPMSLSVRSVRRVRVEPDADVDGKKRTTSPDCPAHGDQSRQATTAPDGGRADAESTRSARTDVRHDQARLDGHAPTALRHEPSLSHASSDSPDLSRGAAANPRSSGTRRTDPAPATTEPCTPSAETHGRTENTPASPALSEPHPGTPASRTSPDGSPARPSAGTPADSDCTCEWYVEHTENTSHFAAFPEALVRRCLLAGCPERVCRECGKASERLVETWHQPVKYPGGVETPVGEPVKSHKSEPHAQAIGGPQSWEHGRARRIDKTVGWSDCGCLLSEGDSTLYPEDSGQGSSPSESKWRPGVVLDPFAGSGTTLYVARNHGRHSVGIELNREYCELASRRLAQQSLLTEGALSPSSGAV